MKDSKLGRILEKVMSKTSDIQDEKFTKLEQSLRNDTISLRNDLSSVKELNKKESSKVRESGNAIEDGQKLIEKEFKEQKENIKDLIKNQQKNVLRKPTTT